MLFDSGDGKEILMGQFFLVKEHNYAKIDGSFRGQDRKLILGSYDTLNDAINDANKEPQEKDDVIYVVEVVGKVYGDLKQ